MKTNSYWDNLHEIKNEKQLASIHNSMSLILTHSIQFRHDWLRSNGWIALPVIYSIIEEDARSISDRVADEGYMACSATWIEKQYFSTAFEIPVSEDGILAFGGASHVFPMILLPFDFRFAILSKGDPDHHIIAGKKDFVIACLSHSINETKSRFEAELNLEDPIRQKLLRKVLAYYDEFITNL